MSFVSLEPSPLDTELDAELLLNVFAGDETECRQAANAFYRRYVNALYNYCKRFQQTLGGKEVVDELVIMTFQRAFECADDFNSNGIADLEHSHARTFRWLMSIAKNLMRDWLKSIGENHPLPFNRIANSDRQIESRLNGTEEKTKPQRYARLPDDADKIIHDPTALQEFIGNDAETSPIISPEQECLKGALATLKEREREVLLLSALYSTDGKQLRLPPDELDGLCVRWKTTKVNLRAIRMRALAKVKEYVEKNC